MAKTDYKPGDTVELANKDVGFYDRETGFKIVRDQKEKLGDTIGTRTGQALMSGGLLVVGSKKSSSKSKGSDLPEDLPGRDAFIEADIDYEKLKAMAKEDIDSVKGIGPKTLTQLEEWIHENKPE